MRREVHYVNLQNCYFCELFLMFHCPSRGRNDGIYYQGQCESCARLYTLTFGTKVFNLLSCGKRCSYDSLFQGTSVSGSLGTQYLDQIHSDLEPCSVSGWS
jgi:hypothetical protein